MQFISSEFDVENCVSIEKKGACVIPVGVGGPFIILNPIFQPLKTEERNMVV